MPGEGLDCGFGMSKLGTHPKGGGPKDNCGLKKPETAMRNLGSKSQIRNPQSEIVNVALFLLYLPPHQSQKVCADKRLCPTPPPRSRNGFGS